LLRLSRRILPLVTLPGGSQTRYEEVYTYDGPNAGSGAFVYVGGWSPTRVVGARGYATDSVFDAAYRLVRTVRRLDDGAGIASDAPARLGEPLVETAHDDSGNPIVAVTLTEIDGAPAQR